MANIPDTIHLTREEDRRVKLTEEHKESIRQMYFEEHLAIREIARQYEDICSRRAIQFVLFPERDAKLKANVKKERRWLKYYDTEKHGASIKDLRAYKRKLFGLRVFKTSQEITLPERMEINKLVLRKKLLTIKKTTKQ